MAETGFVQAFKWDEQGDTPSYNSGGLIRGGALSIPSADTRRLGIGGQALWSAGGIVPAVSPQLDVTDDTLPLIAHAVRASYPAGALTEIMCHVGTAAHDWLLENAVIRQLTLSGAPGQPLAATIDILALAAAKASAGAEEPAVGTALEYYMGSVAIDGDPYDCRSFQAVLNNNVNPRFNLDEKVATSARFPGSLSLGAEEISLRMTLGTYLAYAILADTPARDVGVIIVYTDGVNTLTLTFTGLAVVGGTQMPFVGGSDDVLWDIELQGAPGSLAIT